MAKGSYFTACIYQLVSEIQFPHKIAHSLLIITHQNIKLTVLWGNDFLKPIDKYIVLNKVQGLGVGRVAGLRVQGLGFGLKDFRFVLRGYG